MNPEAIMKKFFSKLSLDQIRLVVVILVVALFVIGASAPLAIGGIGGNHPTAITILPLW
jgi:hypothetical protein